MPTMKTMLVSAGLLAATVTAAWATHWHDTYSPDIPYQNIRDYAVNARSGPGTGYRIVGKVKPGDGGFIIACSTNKRWCKIPFGGGGRKGWVWMKNFGGNAS